MKNAIDALVSKTWTIEGEANKSLADAGYTSMGIDEGWEGCGQGINGTQHTASGDPVINNARFPDMKGLVDYGHSNGLKIGQFTFACSAQNIYLVCHVSGGAWYALSRWCGVLTPKIASICCCL